MKQKTPHLTLPSQSVHDIFRNARIQRKLGNFGASASLLRQLIRLAHDSNNLPAEINAKSELQQVEDLHKRCLPGEIGVAAFPIFGRNGGSRILTITAQEKTRKQTCDYDPILAATEEALEIFFDTRLRDKRKTIRIKPLDLKLSSYSFVFSDLNGKTVTRGGFTGSSYGLAAAVALASRILNVPVPAEHFFSGIIGKDSIKSAESIDDKVSFILSERSPQSTFYIAGPLRAHHQAALAVQTVNTVADTLEKLFATAQLRSNDIKIGAFIELESVWNTAIGKGEKATVYTFRHTDVPPDGTVRVYEFLKSVSDLVDAPTGIIIDGLRASYMLPMLLNFIKPNNIAKFLAVREFSGADSQNHSSKGVIVQVAQKNSSRRKPGERFIYSLK